MINPLRLLVLALRWLFSMASTPVLVGAIASGALLTLVAAERELRTVEVRARIATWPGRRLSNACALIVVVALVTSSFAASTGALPALRKAWQYSVLGIAPLLAIRLCVAWLLSHRQRPAPPPRASVDEAES